MAYIERRRRKSGWMVRYRDPAGRVHGKAFRRKIDAEHFAASIETAKIHGTWTDPGRGKVRIEDWAATWLSTKVDLRKSSKHRLEGVVRTHILPEFGDYPLNRVGNSDVRLWVAKLISAGHGASTVRKSFNALSQMMRSAVSDRRIAFNPCDNVPLPVEDHGEQRFLTASETRRLADEIEPRFRVLVLLAAYGGLRFGELAALRRSRVDLLRGRIVVDQALTEVNGELAFGPPKTKRSRRTVPLPRRIIDQLEQHLDEYVTASPDALVFTGPKGGCLRRAGFRRAWWQPAVAAAGLSGLKFHELRHTFVAIWIAAGANPKEISVRAGHSSVAFTLDRYGHLYEDAEDQISDRLDALLFTQDAHQARTKNVVEMNRGDRDVL